MYFRCGHPHDDPGSHLPPPPEYQLSLVELPDWKVTFNDTIRYNCDPNTWIENDTLPHPKENHLDVACLNVLGTYDIPDVWPNCTETVRCGQPPDPTPDGTRYFFIQMKK